MQHDQFQLNLKTIQYSFCTALEYTGLVVTDAFAVNYTYPLENGSTAVLECPIFTTKVYPAWSGPPGTTAYTLESTDNFNNQLTNRDRLSWATNNRDLQLRNVTRGDEGIYVCVFSLPFSSS